MRKTLVLILIAAALAAYVYLYEIKGGEQRQKEKEIAEKLFTFKKDSVDYLKIEAPGKSFVFIKGSDGWQIDQPVKTGADESPINSLLSSLTSQKKQRTIRVAGGNWAPYELDERAIKLQIKGKGDLDASLKIGAKTSVGSNVFVTNNDSVAFIVSSTLKTNADKKLFDWRDKKAIHLKKDQIREFSIKSPKGRFRFSKEGSDWYLKEPIETKAEKSSVDAVLNKLDYGRIKSVVAEQASRLSKYGLNRPAYRIDLFSGAEKAKLGISFSALKGNKSYGKDDVRPHVFEVDSLFLKPFRKNLFAFRDKKIMDFNRTSADRLNLLYKGDLLKFNKDTTSSWVLESGEKAKGWKISNILSTLENLKATKFVDEKPAYLRPYGLDNPDGLIEVFKGDEKIAQLEVGLQKDELVYVRNADKKAVVTIKKDQIEKLFPKRDELLEEVKQEEKEASE